jgi:hypothetical protein
MTDSDDGGDPQDPPGDDPETLPDAAEFPFRTAYERGIIPRVLPLEQVHLLSGASGVGKTALLTWMLRQFVQGDQVFGHATNKPSFVRIVVVDRAWADHAMWLDAVGLDLPHVSFVDSGLKLGPRHQRVATLMGVIEQLRSDCGLVDGFPDGSLIVVDPIALFLGGKLNDYDTCGENMLALNQAIIKSGITMLGVVHAGKQKNDSKERYTRPQDRILGSTALTSHAGTVLHLAPPTETDSEFHELTWVPHHAPARTFQLVRGEGTGLFEWHNPDPIPDEPTEPAPPKKEKAEVMPERAFVLLPLIGEDVIAGEPVGTPTIQIVEHAAQLVPPIPRATVFRYLDWLQKFGFVMKMKHGLWTRTTTEPTRA